MNGCEFTNLEVELIDDLPYFSQKFVVGYDDLQFENGTETDTQNGTRFDLFHY